MRAQLCNCPSCQPAQEVPQLVMRGVLTLHSELPEAAGTNFAVAEKSTVDGLHSCQVPHTRCTDCCWTSIALATVSDAAPTGVVAVAPSY